MKSFQTALRLVLVGCVALMVLAGCTANAPVSSSLSLSDHLGREVELSGPAERVIGTHNPSMNMVVVISGDGSRLAGFGNKDMAYGLYDLVAPEINQLTQIGKGKTLNMETVLTVEPDLAVLPARFQAQADQLAEIGVPAIVLQVEKFDSIKDALALVGKALGQDERAAEIVTFFDQKISQVSAVAAQATEKPTVLMLSGSSRTEVSTDAMLQNQMIEMAGGTNVTAGFQSDDLWTEVNIEQIVAWNPEVIYIPAYADYTVEDILTDRQWASIAAVKNQQVHQFPSQLEPWDYPVAASVLGLCWTSHNLHPDLYSFDDLMTDVDEFYQFVYGQTFSAEQLGISR